jgi:hypothetical protein
MSGPLEINRTTRHWLLHLESNDLDKGEKEGSGTDLVFNVNEFQTIDFQ